MKTIIIIMALFSSAMFITLGCCAERSWPERISTSDDILKTDHNAENIDIWNLPIQDYSLLAKFTMVKYIMLDSSEGVFATNDKLKALAALNLTNVISISLLNCRLITDEGIRSLSTIRSLKRLGLEGTLVTDAGCEAMASKMQLIGISVANCPDVTLKGLKLLAASESLQEFSFSSNKLSQDEVLDLINSFKNVTWCQIVDPQQRLDIIKIKKLGEGKNVHIIVKPTGALQDKYGKED